MALLFLVGCEGNPAKSDAFVSSRAGFPDDPLMGAVLYLPNRLIDVLDIVHLGIGIGYATCLPELHFTRYGRLGANAGAMVGVGWLGRFRNPGLASAFAHAHFGPWGGNASEGWKWKIPKWDVGVFWPTFFPAYAAIAPDEIADFFAGLAMYDLKDDDWRYTRASVQREVEAERQAAEAEQ